MKNGEKILGDKKSPCGPCAMSVNNAVLTDRSEPMMYLWCTHDTMAQVHGYARVCQIRYCTCTCKHHDSEPVGFPILMTNPIYSSPESLQLKCL